MEFEILGWPVDGPTLDLDHERFAYAGKFVMSSTGKAVARGDNGELLGAVAFSEDRTDEGTCWLRYVTVRADRRGEGIGPRLLAFTRDSVAGRGYDRVRIAVNNPFAYEACYRAGFEFTGTETGIAELVLAWPTGADEEGADGSAYDDGLARFLDRELDEAERAFVEAARDRGRPARDQPGSSDR